VIHPIPIASIQNLLSNASSDSGAGSVNNIVSTQASLTPSLVSKTSFIELNSCLHPMYGNDFEIAWQERTVYDMAHLTSIQSAFDSNDAFLVGL
jgi:hypothetical protein